MHNLTLTLAVEWISSGVRINCVAPVCSWCNMLSLDISTFYLTCSRHNKKLYCIVHSHVPPSKTVRHTYLSLWCGSNRHQTSVHLFTKRKISIKRHHHLGGDYQWSMNVLYLTLPWIACSLLNCLFISVSAPYTLMVTSNIILSGCHLLRNSCPKLRWSRSFHKVYPSPSS